MRRPVLTWLMAAAILAPALAPALAAGRQARGPKDAQAVRETQKLRAELGLSKAQARKLSALLAASDAEETSLRAKMLARRRKTRAAIFALLTRRQRRKFEELAPEPSERTQVNEAQPEASEDSVQPAPTADTGPAHPGVMVDDDSQSAPPENAPVPPASRVGEDDGGGRAHPGVMVDDDSTPPPDNIPSDDSDAQSGPPQQQPLRQQPGQR